MLSVVRRVYEGLSKCVPFRPWHRWAVAEFGFTIREVSIYFSIPAMAFLFISPFGGMVVVGLGRIVALFCRASTSHQIR